MNPAGRRTHRSSTWLQFCSVRAGAAERKIFSAIDSSTSFLACIAVQIEELVNKHLSRHYIGLVRCTEWTGLISQSQISIPLYPTVLSEVERGWIQLKLCVDSPPPQFGGGEMERISPEHRFKLLWHFSLLARRQAHWRTLSRGSPAKFWIYH